MQSVFYTSWIINFFELVAATTGLYFVFHRELNLPEKIFVAYLWLIVLVESYGLITVVAYFSDYEWFSFLKDTFFRRNEWAYNIYYAIHVFFMCWYFYWYLKDKWSRNLMLFLGSLGFIISLVFMFKYEPRDVYFSPILNATKSIFILTGSLLSMIDILKSDKLLNLKSYFPFYVSIGNIFFILITTPIMIYGSYYTLQNPFFVEFKGWVYLVVNVLLYSLFSLAFVLCYRKKNSA
jgi:hypothetical protein